MANQHKYQHYAWLVRFLITLSVCSINLYFKMKDVKINKVLKRVPKRATGATSSLSQSSSSQSKIFLQNKRDALRHKHKQQQQQQQQQQHQRKDANSDSVEEVSARSNLPKIDVYMRNYYVILHLSFYYILLKNLLMCLIKLDSFAHLRYLDCYLIGRLIVNGRATELTPYCACFLAVMRIIWPYAVMRQHPEFKMHCLEFLLDRQGHLPYWSREREREAEDKISARPDSPRDEINGRADFRSGKSAEREHGEEYHSALLEYRNLFIDSPQGGAGHTSTAFKVRPNRTPVAWDALARRLLRFYMVSFTLFIPMVAFFYQMALPVSVTQQGFALNYRHCLQWIANANPCQQQQQPQPQPQPQPVYSSHESSSPYEAKATLVTSSMVSDGHFFGRETFCAHVINQIYKQEDFSDDDKVRTGSLHNAAGVINATRLAAAAAAAAAAARQQTIIWDFFMPFSNLVPFNCYHLIRISMEHFESIVLFLEVIMALNGSCFMSIMLSSDIVYYCSAINKRLESLIENLRISNLASWARTDNISLFTDDNASMYEKSLSGRRRYAGSYLNRYMLRRELELAQLKRDASEIQAMIADLFILIDSYNRYLSMQTMVLIITWLGYSALVTSWIFVPGNESPKLEWYLIHFCITIYKFINLTSTSGVKANCRRMYSLITSAMALDRDYKKSKTIWLSLLEFYTPKPLYCFKMLGSVEITNLMGLKLLAWLVSALIVASSFFQVYNIK